MFGQTALGAGTPFGGARTQTSSANSKAFEVVSPPEDSISSLAFSPAALQQNFLIAGSWDNNVRNSIVSAYLNNCFENKFNFVHNWSLFCWNVCIVKVRCWEVEPTGKTVPKSMQTMDGPVLDVCWTDVSTINSLHLLVTSLLVSFLIKVNCFVCFQDGTKVMMASCDKQVKCWDLGSNQTIQVAQHDAPVKTCHWIKSPTYSCLMTGSWDKTLKFWDLRSANPIMTINLPERCYGAAVVSTTLIQSLIVVCEHFIIINVCCSRISPWQLSLLLGGI